MWFTQLQPTDHRRIPSPALGQPGSLSLEQALTLGAPRSWWLKPALGVEL